jgi:hypothetical protein
MNKSENIDILKRNAIIFLENIIPLIVKVGFSRRVSGNRI